jgi:hypothetical protein
LNSSSAVGFIVSTSRTMVRGGAGRTGATSASAVPLYVFTAANSGDAGEEERRSTEEAFAKRAARKKAAATRTACRYLLTVGWRVLGDIVNLKSALGLQATPWGEGRLNKRNAVLRPGILVWGGRDGRPG